MKNFVRSLLMSALLFGANAFAQTGTVLCSPPQTPSCVYPQWGAIQPDGTDGLTTPSTSIAANKAMHPTLVRVALSIDPAKAVAPKIVVDDGKKYSKETKSLVAAIKTATFDADGKLVSGADEIKAALDRVNAVSRNHQLVLYLKTSPKLADGDRSVLARKVDELNVLLDSSAKSK